MDILGAIDASISLAERVYKVVQALRESKSDLKELEDEIKGSQETLITLASFCEEYRRDGFGDAEIFGFQINRVLEQLNDFQATCSNLHENYKPFIGRIRIAINVREISAAKDKLAGYLDNLELLLLVGNLRQSRRIGKTIDNFDKKFDELEGSLLAGKTKEVFEDLVASLYESGNPQRSKVPEDLNKPGFQPPTWIFSDPSFQLWDSLSGSKWLCCFGKQGAGKSSLASFLARELQKTIPGKPSLLKNESVLLEDQSGIAEVGVAIYYYNYKRKQQQGTMTVLKSLCGQLLEQLWRADPFQAHQRCSAIIAAQTNFSADDSISSYQEFLRDIVGDFKRAYIIVDALDENLDDYEHLLVQLRKVVLVKATSIRSSNVRVLLTSRDFMTEYAERLEANRVMISPSHAELKRYINARLEKVAHDDSDDYSFAVDIVEALYDSKLLIKATETIASAADRSYLLARIHVDTLQGTRGGRTLEERLEKLAKTGDIESVMQGIFDRIDEHSVMRMRELGKAALMWAICAKRSLTVDELLEAAAASLLPSTSLGPATLEMVPQVHELVESTCFLLDIKKDTSIVETHKSLRDFYDKNSWAREKHFGGNTNIRMASTCLRYLTLDHFQSGHCTSEADWRARVRRYPFLIYTAANWGHHVRDSGESHASVAEFFDSPTAIATAGQALHSTLSAKDRSRYSYMLPGVKFMSLPADVGPILPPLHLAAHFNLHVTACEVLKTIGVNTPSFGNFSALFIACQQGNYKTMKVLLDAGADLLFVNGQQGVSDGFKMFAFNTAVFHGHQDTVKEILARSQDKRLEDLLLQKNRWDGTVIFEAARGGHKEILQLVMDHCPRTGPASQILLAQDYKGVNALWDAMWTTNYEMFQVLTSLPGGRALLFQHNKDWKDTILHAAVSEGRTEAARTLMRASEKQKAKIDLLATKQQGGKTPLHLATERRYEHTDGVMRVLLNNGANPAIRDNEGMTALHRATVSGNWKHLRTLIECGHGGLLRTNDGFGRSPLRAGRITDPVYMRDRNEVVRMLFADATIDPGVQRELAQIVTSSRDKDFIAAALDHHDTSLLLIPWAFEYCLRSPLQRILSKNPTAATAVFSMGDSKTSLLHSAAEKGFVEGFHVIVQLLPDKHLLMLADGDGNTPLHIAIAQGNTEFTAALFDAQPIEQARIAVHSKNKTGKTPLNLLPVVNWPELTSLVVSKASAFLSPEEIALHVTPDISKVSYVDPTMSLKLNTPTKWKSARCMRLAWESAEEPDGAVIYLLSPPVPPQAHVQRIIVRVTSHDQGFASYNQGANGTFNDCHSWIELSRYRDDLLHWGERLTVNYRAKKEAETHTIAWDRERGIVGKSSQQGIPHSHTLAKRFLEAIREGDRVAVVLRAEFRGWRCEVQRGECEIYWTN